MIVMNTKPTLLERLGFNSDITYSHLFLFLFSELRSRFLNRTVLLPMLVLACVTLSVQGSSSVALPELEVPVADVVEKSNQSEVEALTVLVERQLEALKAQQLTIDKVMKENTLLEEERVLAVQEVKELKENNGLLTEKVKSLERRLGLVEDSNKRDRQALVSAIFN